MEYLVIKVYNNNVVLAQANEREVILVSKGIGFGKKPGDRLAHNDTIEKVFHELTPLEAKPQLEQIDDIAKNLSTILKPFFKIAEDKLAINLSDYKATLEEHIKFAIERLQMGFVIENPFLDEIKTLYKAEYKLAGIARELIKRRFNIEIEQEEQGFIALHLYAARTNNSVSEALKLTYLMREALNIIEKNAQVTINIKSVVWKQFCNNLKLMLRLQVNNEQPICLFKDVIEQKIPQSYLAAFEIADYILIDKNIAMSEDAKAYIAIEIEKLVQYMKKHSRTTKDLSQRSKNRVDSKKCTKIADKYIKQFGGKSNIKEVDGCMTRLRVTVNDHEKVDECRLNETSNQKVIQPSKDEYYIILGHISEAIASDMKLLCREENV
ncbi:MAG: PRD domain-containing protein [Cellulosilyticaceae bacterium]